MGRDVQTGFRPIPTLELQLFFATRGDVQYDKAGKRNARPMIADVIANNRKWFKTVAIPAKQIDGEGT